MNYPSSPERAAESGDQSSSDGKLSATSSVTITVSESSGSASETEFSTTPRSSLMCERSTEDPIVAAWISSLPVSPVSPSAPQESAEGNRTNETCGPIPLAFLEKSAHGGRSWRTSQGSFLPDTLERSSVTFPPSGSMRDGKLYPRSKSERRICAEDFGLLPTPAASGFSSNLGGGQGRVGKLRPGLLMMARHNLWPTASVKGNYNKIGASKTSGDGLATAVARCGECGPLNPEFVEWLMGWPIGATGLEPLETDRFLEFLQKHGGD